MNKLLILLKKIMISCVILTFLFNYINSYDMPLSIEPMYANFNYWDEEIQMSCNYNRRIENFYYLRNFNDDKEDLKHIVNFLKDSIDNNEHYIKLCESDWGYYDDGTAYYNGDSFIIELEKLNSQKAFFNDFQTFSKYSRYKDYNQIHPYNYNYDIEYYDNSTVITFNYYKLNSDILQKFLNVVYFKKHEFDYAYIKDKTINKPKNYYLLNGKENKIEVAVNYHHEYKNYFTIDIY